MPSQLSHPPEADNAFLAGDMDVRSIDEKMMAIDEARKLENAN